jgi:hypothetical protein
MLEYTMRVVKKNTDFEHINIEYEGGRLNLRFKEYKQTLTLFKKVQHYGGKRVVVSSSAWYEREITIAQNEHRYFCMLCNGSLLKIDKPRRDNEYGDECVILKISNLEGVDMDEDED